MDGSTSEVGTPYKILRLIQLQFFVYYRPMHIKMCSDVQNRVGTQHIKMCLHVHTRVGTPHMPIGVSDQMFKLGWGHRTRSKMFEILIRLDGLVAQAMWWVGRLRRLCGGWVGCAGYVVTIRIIMPLRGSILQVGTCGILS